MCILSDILEITLNFNRAGIEESFEYYNGILSRTHIHAFFPQDVLVNCLVCKFDVQKDLPDRFLFPYLPLVAAHGVNI